MDVGAEILSHLRLLPSRVVKPKQMLDFFEFIWDEVEPKAWEGFVLLTLIRSKGLKEKFGFKGSDHSLGLRWVPGYLSKRKGLWRLATVALSEAWRADAVPNVYWRGGKELIVVPPELIAIMVSPNPGNWVKGASKAVEEFLGGLTSSVLNMLKSGEVRYELAEKVLPRLDVRVPANMMKYTRKVFGMLDIDSKKSELLNWALAELPNVRAVVETPHGYHVLFRLDKLEPSKARRVFRELPEKAVEKFAEVEGVSKEEAKARIELKTKFQEPIPGMKYQGGFIVRFKEF